VDVAAAVVADEQAFELVEPGEGALNDPAVASEPGAVVALAAGDLRLDPAAMELATVLVMVVASVGRDTVGSTARPANTAAHWRHALDERDQLGDVVAVTAGERPGERDPGRVDQEVVFGAVSGPVNRARARRGAPLFACT
jgi:hypothetical protein